MKRIWNLYEKEDLVTLRPGREYAWLDGLLERTLKVLRCRLIKVFSNCRDLTVDRLLTFHHSISSVPKLVVFSISPPCARSSLSDSPLKGNKRQDRRQRHPLLRPRPHILRNDDHHNHQPSFTHGSNLAALQVLCSRNHCHEP